MKRSRTKLALLAFLGMMSVVSAWAQGNVAKIDNAEYATLQEAVDDAYANMTGDVTITLMSDITANTVVRQKAGLNQTIDGNDKTITGQILIDGKGFYGDDVLVIKNINFTGNITNFVSGKDAFVGVPKPSTLPSPYTGTPSTVLSDGHNITIENCSFTSTSGSYDVVGFKSESNANVKGLTITNCTGSNLHSFAQLTGTTDATFDNCTANSSGSFIGVNGGGGTYSISNCTFPSSKQGGYAIRVKNSSTANVTLADNDLTATDVIVIGSNATVTVQSGEYEGNIDKSAGTLTITGGTFSTDVTDYLAEGYSLVNNNGVYTVFEGNPPVAKIGDTYYGSLAEAVAAATAGQTVKVIAAGTYTLPNIPNNITLEGDVEGVVFNHTTAGSVASVPNGATFKNVTFNFGNVNYHGFQHAGTINMEGCTLNGKFFSYGDMNFTSCQFVQTNSDYHMWAYSGDVTYTDCTFTNDVTGKFLNVYNESGATRYSVTVNGCTFINNASAANKAALNVKATCVKDGNTLILAYDVIVNNCTTQGAFPAASTSDALVVLNELVQVDDRPASGVDNITVTLNGEAVYPTPVAQIGENKYPSLDAAIAAATAGQTIELLADITTETGNKSLKEGVTLDGKGKTISGDIAIYISKNGGTVQNVNFKNIHNTSKKKSAIYSESLAGAATITGCTFDNCDWDAIQVTPVAGANIVITNNTFSDDTEDGIKQQRYIHIQSAQNVDFSATVTGNVMPGELAQEPLGVYYPTDKTKVNLTNNYIESINDVCILIAENNGFAGELVFPAYTTADKEETYSPEAYVKNGDYAATYYMTFIEAATAAGNDNVITLVSKVNDTYFMSEGQTLKVKKNGKSITVKAPEGLALVLTSSTTDGVTTYTLVEADLEYTTVSGAVSYKAWSSTVVSGSGTYKLLKDVTTTARLAPGIMASDVTLDLNGHTLTSTATDCAILLSRAGTSSSPKTFNLIDTSDEKGGMLKVNPSVNIGIEVSGKYNQVTIGEGVTIDGDCVALLSENQTLTVNGTINGGNDFAVATNGSTTKNATIIVNEGAVLTSDVAAMYLPGNEGLTATINGGTITGGNTGIEIRAGQLIVNGGDITSTATEYSYTPNGNGTTTKGAAIAVVQHTTLLPINAQILDGTLTGLNQIAVVDAQENNLDGISLKVKDGLTATTTIPEGFKWVSNGDGTSSLAPCEYVAQVGEQQFESLAAAIEAAESGATIQLLKDVTENISVSGGKNFTLDLNEKTLTGYIDQYESEIIVQNGTLAGTVYVNGGPASAEAGYNKFTLAANATITSDWGFILYQGPNGNDAYGSVININGTVNGTAWVMGNITEGNSVINVNSEAKIEGDVFGLNGLATLNVKEGATIIGAETGIEVRAGILNVEGGTITSTASEYTYAPNGSGTTTTGAAIAVAQHTTLLATEANILGGTLSGVKTFIVIDAQSNSLKDVTVKLKDGLTANAEIPADFKWVSNGDGTSSLAPNDAVAMIGNTYYSTFTAAVEAATEDDVITLLADIEDAYTLAEGETLKVALNTFDLTVNAPEGFKVETSEVDGVTTYTLVVIPMSEKDITLIDGEPYTFTADTQVKSVTYKRNTFGSDRVKTYQAWFVPFDYTITAADVENFNFYKINMIANSREPGETVDTEKAWIFLDKVDAGTKLYANRPYIFKPLVVQEEAYEFTAERATLKAIDTASRLHNETSVYEYDFYGNYATNSYTDTNWMYYVDYYGQIGYDKNITVGSYRWFIRTTSKTGEEDGYARSFMFVDGSESTGISSAAIENLPAGVYTLNGMKVENPGKGVYLIKSTDGSVRKVSIK